MITQRKDIQRRITHRKRNCYLNFWVYDLFSSILSFQTYKCLFVLLNYIADQRGVCQLNIDFDMVHFHEVPKSSCSEEYKFLIGYDP